MFPVRVRSTSSGRLNQINIDFRDPGSISARFLAKESGPEMVLSEAKMTFRYEDSFCAANELEGYERLIVDAMNGDQSLFTSAAQVQRLWEVAAPLLEHPPPARALPTRILGALLHRRGDRTIPLAPAREGRETTHKSSAPNREQCGLSRRCRCPRALNYLQPSPKIIVRRPNIPEAR